MVTYHVYFDIHLTANKKADCYALKRFSCPGVSVFCFCSSYIYIYIYIYSVLCFVLGLIKYKAFLPSLIKYSVMYTHFICIYIFSPGICFALFHI